MKKNKTMKITKDGFIWKLIKHDTAHALVTSGVMEVYGLRKDDSESLIENTEQLKDFEEYGIEVGKIKD